MAYGPTLGALTVTTLASPRANARHADGRRRHPRRRVGATACAAGRAGGAMTTSPEAEPIHGFVDRDTAASIEFTGWLELMSEITKLRDRTTDDREAT
jgi:hypothetical protein